MVCNLVSIYFDTRQVSIQQKQSALNFRLLIQRYAQFWFFRKGSGSSFPTTFCVWFFKKCVSLVTFYYKFHCLIVVTSWDIWQYVYCNCCTFQGWYFIKFEIKLIFLIEQVLYVFKESRQTFKYLENKKNF